MNVIFHLNETRRFDHCYSNINNLMKESQAEEIHLLINGDPVSLAVLGVEDRLQDLLEKGIIVSVCQNALNVNNIAKEDLIKNINIVPIGVFELMKRQEQGYSYIRP